MSIYHTQIIETLGIYRKPCEIPNQLQKTEVANEILLVFLVQYFQSPILSQNANRSKHDRTPFLAK